MKISTAINFGFLAPLTVASIIIIITSIISINTNKEGWINIYSNYLERTEKETIVNRTNDRTDLTNNTFEQVFSDIELLFNYTTDILNNNLKTDSYYDNYYGIESINPDIPSEFHSNFFNKDIKTSEDYNNFILENNLINKTTILVNVFRVLYNSNNNYVGMYIGTEDKTFRHYPPADFTEYPTFFASCDTDLGYNPKCRDWYKQAISSNGEVILTSPYTDALTGDTLITSSKAIYDNNDILLGAIGIDISIAALEQQIIDSKILETGYTYLMDENNIAVIYPELRLDRQYNILDLEFSSQSDRNGFIDIINEDEAIYTKNNEEWYYSSKKIGNYRLVMTVRLEELIKSATDIENDINISIIISIIIFIIVCVIMITVGLYMGNYISNTIIKPIESLTKFLSELSKGEYNVELNNVKTDETFSEIVEIKEKFNWLLTAIRFGNKAYYANDLDKAYDTYKKAEKMMEITKNKRGLGVCWNNLSAVYKQKNNFIEAEKYANMAIKNAKETKDTNAEAGRLMNLGVCLKDKTPQETDKALNAFQQAEELYRNNDSKIGIAQSSGNIAQLYISIGKIEEADKLIKATNDIVFNEDNKDPISKQYAAMNTALLFKIQNEKELAISWNKYALDKFKIIDSYVQNICLNELVELFKDIGDNETSNEIATLIGRSSYSDSKDIKFVLDISGSMSGDRIKICRNSITDIITNYIDNNDIVSLYKFDNIVELVFSDEIGSNKQKMIEDVQYKTNTRGTTAFYDAVYKSIIDSTKENTWIIALTDGDDNSSKYTPNDIKEKLNKNMNILIITVGNLSNSYVISDIINKSKSIGAKSQIINANNGTEGIKAAFETVAKVITGQLNIESL